MRTRLSHLAGLLVLSVTFLFGVTLVAAQDSASPVITNAGFTGNFVTGTDGELRFRGVEIQEPANVIVDTPTLCGQTVYGRGELATQSRFRGTNGPCGSTEDVYPGEESIPVAPNSCLDTLGRHRLPPCRG